MYTFSASGRALSAIGAGVLVLVTCGPVAAESDSTKPVAGLAPGTGVAFDKSC